MFIARQGCGYILTSPQRWNDINCHGQLVTQKNNVLDMASLYQYNLWPYLIVNASNGYGEFGAKIIIVCPVLSVHGYLGNFVYLNNYISLRV